MFNLSTFSTISEKVNKYMDDFELENLSQAFEWLALETILSLNDDEIEDVITDGSMDGGLDAVYIYTVEMYMCLISNMPKRLKKAIFIFLKMKSIKSLLQWKEFIIRP